MEPNTPVPDSESNGSITPVNGDNPTVNNNAQISSTPVIMPAPSVVTPGYISSQPTVPSAGLGQSALNQFDAISFSDTGPGATVMPQNTTPGLEPPTVMQPAPQQYFTGGQAPSLATRGGKSRSKKMLLGGLLAMLVVASGLGYVFGFYIPNKPANVYQTGLSRSGDNLTKLVNKVTEQDQLQKIENSEVTANADVKGTDYNYNGTFGVKLSKTKSDGSLDIHIKSGSTPEENLKVKFLTELPTNKQYPNLYFQISGLKGLGLDVLSPDILAYDGKWIAVEADFLESFYSGSNTVKNKENITSAEAASLIKIISNTSNEYLLTSDKNKAVLENKAFIGKENIDNMDTYHYKVGINKSHAKDYCKTLSERVISDGVYKKLLNLDEQGVQDSKKKIDANCDDAIKDLKDDTSLDMWIDAKYKLIHKLRLYDENDKGIYTDIGQTYTGGDKISFFVAYHKEADKSDAKVSIDVDMKAFTSKGTFTWTQPEPNKMDAKITFEAKPYSGEVKADKPADAIKIQELMNKLGFGDFSSSSSSSQSSSSIQAKAKDTERQTDIKAIHALVEAYYAQKGVYPVLADLNNPAWRATNMRGLDSEALKDPDGSTQTLATTATSTQYGYATDKCSKADNGCQAYTLTAVLSTGTTYSKQSLN